MEFNWTIVIMIIVILVTADKLLTVANINAVKKNFPDVDPLSIEKNPLAKYFFEQQGLVMGTILYGLFSILTVLLFIFVANLIFKLCGVENTLSISLYLIMIIYGFVIFNNLYFLLKFSRIIP